MKYLKQLGILFLVLSAITSCNKDELKPSPFASINIINAVQGGSTAKFGNRTTNILNNNYMQYGLVAGDNSIYIYPSTDSLNPYYNEAKFSASNGEVYSLFLTGTPGAVDAIKIKETIPYRTDSTAGIRFINLAPNKAAVNITLSTSSTVNEVSNLAYKNYTDFKTYPALSTNTSYTFQLRDAANPTTVLASQTLSGSSIPRFANITIVVRQNGTSGAAMFIVKNDR